MNSRGRDAQRACLIPDIGPPTGSLFSGLGRGRASGPSRMAHDRYRDDNDTWGIPVQPEMSARWIGDSGRELTLPAGPAAVLDTSR
jgi:hypothetical protein